MSDAEIRRLSRERTDRIGLRDFAEMVDAFYAPDAKLLASGVATLRGIDAIRDFWRATPDEGLVSLTLETRDVEVSGDVAYEVGTFSRTLRPRHGAPFQENGKYVVIYRLTGSEGWRAVVEMFNSDSPR